MKTYLAYIRVSTARQGERGVSLQEQKDAIERYASRNTLTVSRWFEERERASSKCIPGCGHVPRFTREYTTVQRVGWNGRSSPQFFRGTSKIAAVIGALIASN